MACSAPPPTAAFPGAAQLLVSTRTTLSGSSRRVKAKRALLCQAGQLARAAGVQDSGQAPRKLPPAHPFGR